MQQHCVIGRGHVEARHLVAEGEQRLGESGTGEPGRSGDKDIALTHQLNSHRLRGNPADILE